MVNLDNIKEGSHNVTLRFCCIKSFNLCYYSYITSTYTIYIPIYIYIYIYAYIYIYIYIYIFFISNLFYCLYRFNVAKVACLRKGVDDINWASEIYFQLRTSNRRCRIVCEFCQQFCQIKWMTEMVKYDHEKHASHEQTYSTKLAN